MRGVYEEQAIHYEVLGQYESATEQQDLYLSILEAVYGTASYETAGGMIRLAALTRRAGHFDSAIKLANQALGITLEDEGNQQRKDAEAYVELGRSMSDKGLMNEAEQYYRDSLNLTDGRADLITVRIQALNSLCGHLTNYNRPGEARPILEENLQLREERYGRHSQQTIAPSNNLAATYLELERYDLAEPLMNQVISSLRESLGPNHPDTSTAMNNLANLYDKQGMYEQARELQFAVLLAWQKSLGDNHPDVGIALFNLGNSYLRIEKPQEALSYYAKAESVWKSSLSASHPYFVYLSLGNLQAYWMSDEAQQAMAAYRLAMQRSQLAFGNTDMMQLELASELPDFVRWLETNTQQ
ncbi:MAG: tetratricopeptide repeat protein [bacterium]|nr:tetratricopeptide repeat protein [Gammaproteobacteria bacterium]HIL96181.1 tetratricopeptide repeat protein [Pseudomonadales bacterium]